MKGELDLNDFRQVWIWSLLGYLRWQM